MIILTLNKNKQISYTFIFRNFLVLTFYNRGIKRIHSKLTFHSQYICFFLLKKHILVLEGSTKLFAILITQLIWVCCSSRKKDACFLSSYMTWFLPTFFVHWKSEYEAIYLISNIDHRYLLPRKNQQKSVIFYEIFRKLLLVKRKIYIELLFDL